MCNFLSGLTFGPKLSGKFGKFYSDPKKTDHHSEMESAIGLKDRHSDPEWAKWEYTPNGSPADFDNYTFRIDEERSPSWWTPELQSETIAFAKIQLAEVVVSSGKHEAKAGERLIVCGTAEVTAWGNSTVKAWGNSTVKAWENSTVEARGNSTVEARGNSTVEARGNSTVKAWENSTVEAWENSTVKARGNSTVKARGNSTVEARGNSTVEAWENSTVEARGNSTVEARGNSTVEAIMDYAVIIAYGGTIAPEVAESAVVIDRRKSRSFPTIFLGPRDLTTDANP